MTLNELVLANLDGLEPFEIATKTIEGKYRNVPLNNKLYEKLEPYEIKDYYLHINKETNKPCIVVILEDY